MKTGNSIYRYREAPRARIAKVKNGYAQIREIYEKSFPENERRDFDNLLHLIENREQINIFLSVENDIINAMIIYWLFIDFVYIEHFAVEMKYRNKGLGTNILRNFLQNAALPVILEVELPDGETEKKRIAFYERLGFVLHAQKYIQPAYSPEKQQVEMRLMTFGEIDFEQNFGKIKDTLYKNVYNLL